MVAIGKAIQNAWPKQGQKVLDKVGINEGC